MIMPVTTGWLFDAYPVGPRMVFWIKARDGSAVRATDDWAHSIYVGCDNTQELVALAKTEDVADLVSSWRLVNKRERITEFQERQVLQLTLKDSAKALTLGRMIESQSKFSQFRLYNVDVLPAQSYFYEHDLFPLALCDFTQDKG
jgi:DNA polymerase, archaea type